MTAPYIPEDGRLAMLQDQWPDYDIRVDGSSWLASHKTASRRRAVLLCASDDTRLAELIAADSQTRSLLLALDLLSVLR